MHAKIKIPSAVNLKLSKVHFLKPGVSQNIPLHTARYSAFRIYQIFCLSSSFSFIKKNHPCSSSNIKWWVSWTVNQTFPVIWPILCVFHYVSGIVVDILFVIESDEGRVSVKHEYFDQGCCRLVILNFWFVCFWIYVWYFDSVIHSDAAYAVDWVLNISNN